MINFDSIPSPCFVMDEKLLRKNLEILQDIQNRSGAKIILALKGFAMYSTFPLVSKYLQGTTASSLHEARLGFEEFDGEVHAYSPAYMDSEFDELMQYCSHISFNSISQWLHFKDKISGTSISPGLRINPEYSEVATDLYNPASPGSRLGLAPDHLKNGLPEGIEGLHSHTLFESDSSILERTVGAIEEKFGHLLLLPQLKWLNLGGGHALTKRNYDIERLVKLIKRLNDTYQMEVILEPGSAVAWETGYLVSSVQDIIENRGKKTALLDVSFAAHMPDCIEMPYKPRILSGRDAMPDDEHVYAMGGLTCLAGDVIGDYTFEKPLQIGDKVVFDDMMHYTMVKTTTFNGVTHPSIGIVKENSNFELVRKFKYEDFKRRLS